MYICFINAFSKVSLILLYKDNVHWFRKSFELIQLRHILETNCGYTMKFGLVRQESDKKNKQAWFILWTHKCSLFSMRFINNFIERIQVLKI